MDFPFEISLGFDSVAIKQKKNKCASRLDVNIETEVIKGIVRPVPLIASNMSTVTNPLFCIDLWNYGALGVMHRAWDNDTLIAHAGLMSRNCDVVCMSVGICEGQFELATDLIKNGANVLFIDVAHGYSDAVIDLGRKIKAYAREVKVVVGNTTNIDMLNEVADYADAVKVGIGQGLSCSTKDTAGCTEKQFSAVYKFREQSRKLGVPIISDGGIRKPGDFVKAIAAGASSVMAGSIFAACPESSAQLVTVDGQCKKLFAGMASRFVQNQWKGGVKNGTCTEGTIRHLDVGETADKLIERYSGALKSGITYAGSTTVDDFRREAEFIWLM
jgi:IMP dehydrogenase